MKKIVIVKAVRTAIGRFGGALKDFSASQLASTLIRHLVQSIGMDPNLVSEVILGQVYSAGCGMNPARIAAVNADLPHHIPATTVNQVCGSGLKTIINATESIMLDESKVILAGGMESMSQAPFIVQGTRWGHKLGHLEMTDVILQDGLIDAFHHYHMGVTAENVAQKYNISRRDQDLFACQSQQKYQHAVSQSAFQDEIVPLPAASNTTSISKLRESGSREEVFDQDEHPRPDVTIESLSRLKPSFQQNGTVTPGNASGLNDGASMVLMMTAQQAKTLGLEIIAYVKGYANIGLDPQYMGVGPLYAVQSLLGRTKLNLNQIDLFELNEAFAAQSLAVINELGVDPEKVNLNGGAIALGHPLAASGTRITTTLLHLMRKRDLRYGIASLCVGGGMGIAILFERP